MSVPAGGDLRRVIGFWGGTALIIGITIGAGIFRKPYSLSRELNDPWMIMSLWIGFGVISLCGALALAELASMMPRTGGSYVFLRAAYGDSSAFVFGWIYLLVATPAAVGALGTFFGELLSDLLGLKDRSHVPAIGAATIAFLTAANLIGARLGSAIQSIFTAIKVGALLLIMVVSFFLVDGSWGNLSIRSGTEFSLGSLGAGAAAVIWAYDGWIAVSMIAGEVVAAEKLMKRIIVAGMAAIVFLYVGANFAYFHSMKLHEMAQSPGGVPQAIMSKLWSGGGSFISACIMCSVFGALNGNILAKPRVPYALAQDGLTFAFLGKAHPKWSTPYPAILIQSATAIVMLILMRKDPGNLFDKLTTYFVVVEWSALLFTVAAVFVLRRKMPNAERPYRTPWYPFIPLVFLVGTTLGLGAIVYGRVAANDWSPVIGLAISLAGFPVFYLWRALKAGSAPAPVSPP
jgi:APA family basic amino acid/polyamine antiporter